MKKVLLVLFFVSLSTQVYSKDLYTWGFAGGDCKTMKLVLKDYGEEGELAISSAIRGFLTGYNVSQPRHKAKIINSSSTDFVISYLKEFCRKQGDQGEIHKALIKHYKTLPRIK